MQQLILGGARSGKSRLAQDLAQGLESKGKKVIYIATADSSFNDASMDDRISQHQQQRPSHWPTIECPIELGQTLRENSAGDTCLLVDCLSLWLSNCLLQKTDIAPPAHGRILLESIQGLSADIIFVSNEVGLGVIPMGQLSRDFVDQSGFLHQALAQHCHRVIFTAAGLPLVMKGPAL